jgi:hypothetical protein
MQFQLGNWEGSWDNTITYGISWRAEDQDPALLGKGNGGTGEAILTDDGDLNFEKGDIFSNIVKGTSELSLDNGQFGFFGRIKYWYDFELENGKVPHGHSPTAYQPNTELDDSDFADYAKFSGLELLDLFAYGTFDVGNFPLDVRLGRQVINWGEATFIQGVNVLNPIDVSAFRRPGAEIKEGLLPVGLLYANMGLGGGWSLEGFYQYEWEPTVLDGCGTYFSDQDFAAEGCNSVIAPEVFNPLLRAWLPDSILQGINNARKDQSNYDADDGGQFGLAVRNYVEAIDTEFGLYYQNLHNRTPVLGVRYSMDGVTAGSVLGGEPRPVLYTVKYPEDTSIWGLSFATNVGSIAWSGEISLKQDMPVQINGTTVLLGGLGSLAGLAPYPPAGGLPLACVAPAPAQLGQFGERAWSAACDFATTGEGVADGYDRFDVTQAQTTMLYFWDQGLGSERVTLVGELAWVGVNDLPSIAEMPYGRNPIYGSPATGLGGPSDEGFVDDSSWGYRIRAAASYPNVFGGVTLIPNLAWAHDVSGTSPTPSFIDGRKAFSLGLGANYLTRYRGNISYTWFSGGYANTLVDRDFFSITASVDF